MPKIVAHKQVLVPDGHHRGIVYKMETKKTDFKNGDGPQDTIEMTIQPDYKPANGGEVLSLRVSFSPSLNGLSDLSHMLERFKLHPVDGADWDPESFEGTEIEFDVEKNQKGFLSVDKKSIRPAK